jgi:apolipoprotein N-acyltransferase
LPGLLFFVRRFVEASSDFSKGNRYAIMDHGKGDFAVLICYEVIFPESVRQFAKRGATFFVNITNDAWFGRSSAPYQHFDFVKLRAVESGRYFVRCAGTGISGIVSPYGDVLKSTGIFSKEIVTGSIEPLEHRTLYSRTGDLFAFACVIMTVILISPLVSKRSKLSTSSGEGKSED